MTGFVTDPQRSARMSRQRSKDTGPEMALRRALFARGLRYYVHRRPLPDFRRTADVVFPRQRIAVFLDGCFWHGCPQHGNTPQPNSWYWPEKIARNQARDAGTNNALQAAGWRVVRVWEHEDPTDVADRVLSLVRSEGPTGLTSVQHNVEGEADR